MLKSIFGLVGTSKKSGSAVEKNKSNQEKTKKIAQPNKSSVAAKPVQNGRISVMIPAGVKEKTLAEKYLDSCAKNSPVKFNGDSTSKDNVELVIQAAYKQVFGNAHLMESERLGEIESQMRFGKITVSEFIRKLAQSERYRTLFWDKYPTSTFIELNFKHLLGRAPTSQEEIANHTKILAEGGFEAEIDSYLDSDEYFQTFGDYIVPYYRGYKTQAGRKVIGYTHSFPLFQVACGSDKSIIGNKASTLGINLIKNKPSRIPSLRPIPDSYPESLVAVPEKHIPKNIRIMAREVWKGIEARQGHRFYTY